VLDAGARGVPGYRIGDVFVLAGVPSAFREMAQLAIAQIKGGLPLRSVALRAFVGESVVAAPLAAVANRYGDVEIGSYPKSDGEKFYCELVFSGADDSRIRAAREAFAAHLRSCAIAFESAD
jgi:molybdopterin-biosynthesis enzyme MoeA-like protein